MTGRVRPAFYRSPLTRYLFMVTGLICAWSVSPVGPPEWRDTPSLRLLHLIVPWPFIWGLFLIYVALLAWGRLSAIIAADLIGMGLYLSALLALACTIRFDLPANLIATCALGLAVGYHYHAARLAYFQRQEAA